MSIQFGIWNLDGKPVVQSDLDRAAAAAAHYTCDSVHSHIDGNVGILYRSFHTTRESRAEAQPYRSVSGLVITWDGRLDNRAELVHELAPNITAFSTDVEIVAAGYEHWGTNCLNKLVGDWALSVFNSRTKSLVLAKDFLGTRHLYFCIDQHQVVWSTTLDPLVRPGKKLRLSEEYIAGCLALFPAAHLTPFVEIDAVPPASFVELSFGKVTIRKYWEFDPSYRILYTRDAEYEEHFRQAITRAVEPRLRADRPILAHLSGGMDSPTVVRIADLALANNAGDPPRLDTISYISRSEPNWDELPFITKVEEQRGRCGYHIDVSSSEPLKFESDRVFLTPGNARSTTRASRQFSECICSQGYRVVLSGTGGDEMTGGVPTPLPELQDLIASGRFLVLAHKLKVWALEKRKPWFYLLFDAFRTFLPAQFVGVPKHRKPAAWLTRAFVNRNRAALLGYPQRMTFLGAPPSFQDNLITLETLRRQLACTPLPSEPSYETRYPLLDRRLLEFLFAVPSEQLVRPGMRRSLMRRALVGILPGELLNRRRKATVNRAPRAAVADNWASILALTQHSVMSSLNIVQETQLNAALEKCRQGEDVRIVPLIRTLGIEHWLSSLIANNIVEGVEHYRASDKRVRPVELKQLR
jgi:asparagine synthase (glutamine-hydrolysing)